MQNIAVQLRFVLNSLFSCSEPLIENNQAFAGVYGKKDDKNMIRE